MIIGIDPGKTGGIVLLKENTIIDYTKMPDNIYDISNIFTKHKNAQLYVAIEKVGAMPGQGVASMFKFGYNVGVIHGILSMYKFPKEEVTPLKWKKYFNIPGKKANPSLCKEKTIEIARNYIPMMRNIPYHSGIYDAALIALYVQQRKDNK